MNTSKNNFSKFLPILFLLISSFIFSSCSKTSEEVANEFLEQAKTANTPRLKEAFEKKAQYKFTDAVNFYLSSGKPLPKTLKTSILTLELKLLNKELKRITAEQVDPIYLEAAIERVILYREDFTKYLSDIKNKKISEDYAQFLMDYANPKHLSIDEVIDIYKDILNIKSSLTAKAKKKLNKIKTSYSKNMYSTAKDIYMNNYKDAASKKETVIDEAKGNLVFADYYARLALKYNPDNKNAKKLLRRLNKILMDQYLGYRRLLNQGVKPDPTIDRTDIYLAIPSIKKSRKELIMELSLWNLTQDPLNVKRSNFFLITTKGDTIAANNKTKFNKLLIKTKEDTSQTVRFTLKGAKPKMVLFKQKKYFAIKEL